MTVQVPLPPRHGSEASLLTFVTRRTAYLNRHPRSPRHVIILPRDRTSMKVPARQYIDECRKEDPYVVGEFGSVASRTGRRPLGRFDPYKVDSDNITPEIKDAIIDEMLYRNRWIYLRLSQI